jgi:hypothetical protein
VLTTFDRETLAITITAAIDMLDLIDGHAALENACDLEDHFGLTDEARGAKRGPACFIANPEEEDDRAGQCTEDEISTALGTVNAMFSEPGCIIADDDRIEAVARRR